MKQISVLLFGILFGIVLTKGEIISWYRIVEMFHFDSFHMFGTIFSAIAISAIFIALSKRFKWTALDGGHLRFANYPKGWKKYIFGGIIFGFGWALIGACPAPLFILIGNGYFPIIIAIVGAMLGTLLYGILEKKLPR